MQCPNRYLFDNHISDIDSSAFSGLHSLEYLYVSLAWAVKIVAAWFVTRGVEIAFKCIQVSGWQ